LSGRATHPLREVVLVMTMVNHPSLLAAHLDDFAHVEFSHPDLDQLRNAILDIVSHPEGEGADASLREPLAARFGPLIARLEAQIEGAGHWPATPAAADTDAAEGWSQALTLHTRKRTLHKELKDAEAALAGEPSDANLARLVDIQNQLARTEGTEALIEGFGASSGRQARAF
ncbi:MAG: DNA primase, partial [Elusimicrobia bacterium]|nr:DNA primase [Elusimicrobiota bacterium]